MGHVLWVKHCAECYPSEPVPAEVAGLFLGDSLHGSDENGTLVTGSTVEPDDEVVVYYWGEKTDLNKQVHIHMRRTHGAEEA